MSNDTTILEDEVADTLDTIQIDVETLSGTADHSHPEGCGCDACAAGDHNHDDHFHAEDFIIRTYEQSSSPDDGGVGVAATQINADVDTGVTDIPDDGVVHVSTIGGTSTDFASGSLTFNLTDTGGTGAGTAARAAFEQAVELWTYILGDAITVNLDIGFQTLNPGILGSTGSSTEATEYSTVRSALQSDAQSPQDTSSSANLQSGNALTFITQDVNGTLIVDNDNSANNRFLSVNTANKKALGLSTASASDGSVVFSNQFTWDFDPNDGINAGAQDFVGVAFHEIGHALGFVSGVDFVDILHGSGPNAPFDTNGFAVFSVLDLFRFSSPGTMNVAYGGNPYFSVNGGATNQAGFSTGRFQGDGQQASHWKDNQGIGIMDPTANPAGNVNNPSNIDMTAMDVIGYNRLVDYLHFGDQFAQRINGGSARDLIMGRDGNDTLFGYGDDDRLVGGDGRDTLVGGEGRDILSGGDDVDLLNGQGGNDNIFGGAGNDIAYASGGFDQIDGGTGIDWFYLVTSTTGDNWVNLGASGSQFRVNEGGGFVSRGTLQNIENVADSAGDDAFYGNSGNNVYMYSAGFDIVDGNAGYDTLDISQMNSGFQWINLAAPSSQLRSNNGSGWVANAQISDVERFITTDDQDHFYGDNTISTYGYMGGRDFINGGGDFDWVDMSLFAQPAWMNLNIGADQLRYFDGANWQSAGNIYSMENLIGSNGNDFFYGNYQNNNFNGRGGNDFFNGGTGTDTFTLSGTLANYAIVNNGGGTYTVTGISGTDTLVNVELLNIGGTIYNLSSLALTEAEILAAETVETLELPENIEGGYLASDEPEQAPGEGEGDTATDDLIELVVAGDEETAGDIPEDEVAGDDEVIDLIVTEPESEFDYLV